MPEFFNTRAGVKYQNDVNRIAKALERIADSLEKGIISHKQDNENNKRDFSSDENKF